MDPYIKVPESFLYAAVLLLFATGSGRPSSSSSRMTMGEDHLSTKAQRTVTRTRTVGTCALTYSQRWQLSCSFTHQMWRVFALQQHWKTKTILTEVNKARYWTSEDNSYYDTVNPALLMMKDYASNRNLTDWLQLIPVPFTRADWSVFDWYELGEELNETNQGGYFPSHSSCPRYTERSSLFHCFNLYYRPPGVNV